MSGAYVEITESTLNHVLNRAVRSRTDVETASIELHEGFFSLVIEIRKILAARVRVSLEVEAINLTADPAELRFRRRGETDVQGGSFFTDLMLGAVGDPLERLTGWVSFLRSEDGVLEVIVEESPLAPYLNRTVGGFTPGEWFPLREVTFRPGVVRLILECGDSQRAR